MDLESRKRSAEQSLDSAISECAECLAMDLSDESVKSIRAEVIGELLRLKKGD